MPRDPLYPCDCPDKPAEGESEVDPGGNAYGFGQGFVNREPFSAACGDLGTITLECRELRVEVPLVVPLCPSAGHCAVGAGGFGLASRQDIAPGSSTDEPEQNHDDQQNDADGHQAEFDLGQHGGKVRQPVDLSGIRRGGNHRAQVLEDIAPNVDQQPTER